VIIILAYFYLPSSLDYAQAIRPSVKTTIHTNKSLSAVAHKAKWYFFVFLKAFFEAKNLPKAAFRRLCG
jgi:hypothetical protein